MDSPPDHPTLRSYLPLIAVMVISLLAIGRELLPASTMFTFHDQTQYARIIEFTRSLQRLEIPPVWAEGFNFGIGYPVYLFYAPLAYWVAAVFMFLGTGAIDAFRLSMLAGLIVGFFGSYAWLFQRFGRYPAIVGAVLYVTSPWIASEIFVRGNIATLWFMAIAPWSLWAVSNRSTPRVIRGILVALSLITHNALSLLWIPILILYALLAHSRGRREMLRVVVGGILMAGVFWVPALLQLGQTHAREIALLTKYSDHFLCTKQIWTTSSWGYGGSALGCEADGMSFMIGKIELVLAGMGLILMIFVPHQRRFLATMGLLAIWMIFLTLYDSAPLWRIFPAIHVMQFPWRLLSIAHIFTVGLAVGVIPLLHRLMRTIVQRDRGRFVRRIHTTLTNHPLVGRSMILQRSTARPLMVGIFLAIILITSSKYFHGQLQPTRSVQEQFTSPNYIRTQAAYAIPEYVPRSVDLRYWVSFRDRPPAQYDLAKLRSAFVSFQPSLIFRVLGWVMAVVGGIILL